MNIKLVLIILKRLRLLVHWSYSKTKEVPMPIQWAHVQWRRQALKTCDIRRNSNWFPRALLKPRALFPECAFGSQVVRALCIHALLYQRAQLEFSSANSKRVFQQRESGGGAKGSMNLGARRCEPHLLPWALAVFSLATINIHLAAAEFANKFWAIWCWAVRLSVLPMRQNKLNKQLPPGPLIKLKRLTSSVS